MLERHIQCYGCLPRQVAADGGYGSTDNLLKAIETGVQSVALRKKPELSVLDMVKSHWVYRNLKIVTSRIRHIVRDGAVVASGCESPNRCSPPPIGASLRQSTSSMGLFPLRTQALVAAGTSVHYPPASVRLSARRAVTSLRLTADAYCLRELPTVGAVCALIR